ncbi:MAG: protein translocase SEC61 complex subunit gamma [Candidatus Altiarchaeales archaeon IMC4]|nr:MAG: protein translocase SEC61 complex subunit gamma [Candidatus Altiarchaeales archaeon IMC4]
MGIKDLPVKAFKETRRILRLTRKPRQSEFTETSKITGAGVVIIGVIGFIIILIAHIIRSI